MAFSIHFTFKLALKKNLSSSTKLLTPLQLAINCSAIIEIFLPKQERVINYYE